MTDSSRQRQQYENIHNDYEIHYYDYWSMRYREEFFYPLLWNNLDCNGLHVADLASGTGHNSRAILARFPDARMMGFDISPSACRGYEENVGFPAVEVDLTKALDIDEIFDVVFVVAGLHHCIADLEQTIKNIARILKPDGIFVMVEPSSQFFLESIRRLWYKFDSSFDDENERALHHDEVLKIAIPYFQKRSLDYFGGPAFFGVLSSMILHIPLWLKPVLSPPLMAAERLWNRLPGRSPHNMFVAQWTRTSVPVPE